MINLLAPLEAVTASLSLPPRSFLLPVVVVSAALATIAAAAELARRGRDQ